MARLAESECQELRGTVKFLEQELAKSREQNAALVAKYDQMQEEVHHSHDQIARQASQTHAQMGEIEELKRQLYDLAQRPSEENVRAKVSAYTSEIAQRDDEINHLKQLLAEKEDFNASRVMMEEQYRTKTETLQRALEERERETEQMRKQLEEAQKRAEELSLRGKSEGVALLENEHLREDNVKLVALLKRTKEYKNFAEYIEDSGGVVGVTASRSLSQPPQKRSITTASSGLSRKEGPSVTEWVPSEAYKLAQELRAAPLTNELIDKLLANLNRIWRDREKKQIDRVKAKYSTELSDLKRQLVMRAPFDEIQANKHIARLRSDLRNRDVPKSKAPCKISALPAGIDIVDETLKVASSMQRQNVELTEKAAGLLRRVSELEELISGEDIDKARFMEGAAWMAEKLLDEVSRYASQLDELIAEYNRRTQEKDMRGEIDAIFVATTQAWLLEGLDCACGQMKAKVQSVAASAQHQAGAASEKLRSVAAVDPKKSKANYVEEMESQLFDSGEKENNEII